MMIADKWVKTILMYMNTPMEWNTFTYDILKYEEYIKIYLPFTFHRHIHTNTQKASENQSAHDYTPLKQKFILKVKWKIMQVNNSLMYVFRSFLCRLPSSRLVCLCLVSYLLFFGINQKVNAFECVIMPFFDLNYICSSF